MVIPRGGISIAIAFLYIWLTDQGIVTDFLLNHSIDMMGRDALYNEAKSFYTFNPFFLGHGMGSTRKLMESSSITISHLHNSILQFFIEYGFVGMFYQLWYQMINLPKKINTYYDNEIALYYCIVNWYLFFTYLTDNTSGYIVVQNVMLIFIAYFIKNKKELMNEYDTKLENVSKTISTDKMSQRKD